MAAGTALERLEELFLGNAHHIIRSPWTRPTQKPLWFIGRRISGRIEKWKPGAPHLPGFGRCGMPRSPAATPETKVPQRGTTVEAPAFRPGNKAEERTGLQPRSFVSGHDFSRAVKLKKRCGLSPLGSLLDWLHARAAQLRLRRPKWPPAPLAWITIERQPMVHDCVCVRFLHPRQLLVPHTDRTHAVRDGRSLEGNAPAPTKLLRGRHAFPIKFCYRQELSFIQHRYFRLASPAPQNVHTFAFPLL